MVKKRKTLVKDFAEIIATGDMEAFKAVFERCEINATNGYGKETALHFYGLTEEMVCWLVEHGANMNAPDSYSRTPLHKMTSSRGNEVECYIKFGADVNAEAAFGDTPLHFAVDGFKPRNVSVLLEHGANPLAQNQAGQTPLEYALSRAGNADIVSLVEIAEILQKFQPEVTEDMKQAVKKIGETFEFYRSSFDRESLPQTDGALARLYKLFHVTPVPKREVYDGIAPIKVKASTWQKQFDEFWKILADVCTFFHVTPPSKSQLFDRIVPAKVKEKIWKKQFDELWKMLVPGTGAASTVQGGVIRICGKVSREILDNGAANWSKSYKKLPQALPGYCAMGSTLEADDFAELSTLAKSISAQSDEAIFARLSELAVRWVLLNPQPIALAGVEYKR